MTDQQLTPDLVLQQLKTRGFESGGFRSPLRHFRAKLDSITGAMVQRGNMPQSRLEVSYNFSELEVFVSVEPYPNPIAQISIMHSSRKQSAMGVLGASMDKILNASLGENTPQEQAKNQDALIGIVQEWKVTTGHMMPVRDDQGEWKETPRECWEVVYAEGFGGTPFSGIAGSVNQPQQPAAVGVTAAPPSGETPVQRAINLLDGKTQQQWNSIVFQDALVKGDSALVNSVITGQFLPPLEESGIVTKDADGVYHKTI